MNIYETLICTAKKAFPRQNTHIIDTQARDQLLVRIFNSNVRICLIEVSPDDSKEALTLAKWYYAAQMYAERCNIPKKSLQK